MSDTHNNKYREQTDLEILSSQEITVRRQVLFGLFKEGKVDFDAFRFLIDGFDDKASLKELHKIKFALHYGFSERMPDLTIPSNQFLWGAALCYILNNAEYTMSKWPEFINSKEEINEETLGKSYLWKQLTETMRAKKELLLNVNIANSATRRNDSKIKWGKPGRGTKYLYDRGLIVVDMVEALVEGFLPYRSKIATEMSRGIVSKYFPLQMPELHKQIQALKKKQEKQDNNLSPEDYKKLRLLHLEWSMKYTFYNAIEGNVHFDNARNMKDFFYQDIAKALNHYAVILMQVKEEEVSPEKEEVFTELFDNPGEEFMHLCRVIELLFHKDNKLFEDNLEGWHALGLSPEKIRRAENQGSAPYSIDDFKLLASFVQDVETGIQYLKPNVEDVLHGREFFESEAKGYNKGRNILIEQVWNTYGEHLLRDLLKMFEEMLDEQMKQKAEMEKMMEEMRKKTDEQILDILQQVQKSVDKATVQLDSEIKKGTPKP